MTLAYPLSRRRFLKVSGVAAGAATLSDQAVERQHVDPLADLHIAPVVG